MSDDYRLTAAISIVKWVTERYENGNHDDKPHSHKDLSSDQGRDSAKTASSMHRNAATPKNAATPRGSATPRVASRAASRGSNSNVIPVKALTLALEVCCDFLRCKEHLDIDEPINKVSFFQTFDIYGSILLIGTF